jgi:hypothetical protein
MQHDVYVNGRDVGSSRVLSRGYMYIKYHTIQSLHWSLEIHGEMVKNRT